MSLLRETIAAKLHDQAPKLEASLQQQGSLDEYLDNLAAETQGSIVEQTVLARSGLDGLAAVQAANNARHSATEIALHEIDFPSESAAETTASA